MHIYFSQAGAGTVRQVAIDQEAKTPRGESLTLPYRSPYPARQQALHEKGPGPITISPRTHWERLLHTLKTSFMNIYGWLSCRDRPAQVRKTVL